MGLVNLVFASFFFLSVGLESLDLYFQIQSQMTCLVELIQASPEELQQRYYICKVLEQALSPFFPGLYIHVYLISAFSICHVIYTTY